MRWPWSKKPIDPELQQQIERLQKRTSENLDATRQIADESRRLAERTSKTREWAKAMRDENHFAEGYLPPSPRRFRIPWKHSSQS